jgi:hypothetical protein
VQRRLVVRLLEGVRDHGPARRVECEARDPEQGALRRICDHVHPPAAPGADDEADPGAPALDEDGVRREPGDPAFDRRKRRDRARAPGAVTGRDQQTPAVDPRDARRPVTRHRERSLRDTRRDHLCPGRGRKQERQAEEGDEALHDDTVAVSS